MIANSVKQDFLFGMGAGHLPRKAARIAEAHGARLVNYTEPDGRRRHWFASENMGAPFDGITAKEVLDGLRDAGMIE
jgi:hypothetical protein